MCGLPFNWSGIHNKGKSECILKSEVLPLLPASSVNSYLQKRFSGELNIFSNQSIENDSD